jgi:arsenate reductase
MSSDRVYNVLFLCTHNSARSILAEALMDAVGAGRFKGHSAGSMPGTVPNPFALATLARLGLPTASLYSKSWDEFARPGAPAMDFVFTVCDNAANEVCPVWPGHPATAHWGVPDPSVFQGSDEAKLREFARVAAVLKHRIELFASLPLASLDRLSLQARLREIGKSGST